ncbi:MAG: MotA/TolQ/ExbB proton channel family protein [Planctomycetota bacterium]
MFGWETLTQGGYTMAGIFLASVLALTEILYCLYLLRRRVVLPEALVDVAEGRGPDAEPGAAEAACRRTGGPFGEVLLSVLATRRLPREDAEDLVEGAGSRASHTLSRGVQFLELVAAVAPLLGLLGTVIGMYDTFAGISEAGVKHMETLPEGIRKALITTITGLMVAIPSYIFFMHFTRRVEDLTIEMERYAVRMMVRLRQGGNEAQGSSGSKGGGHA